MIRFSCTKCGQCCRFEFPDSTVWVTREELESIGKLLGKSLRELEPLTFKTDGRRSLKARDGWCPFYDHATKMCGVYDARPAQCRSFPFWPSVIGSDDGIAEAARRCEGIGQGDWIPAEEVRLRMRGAPVGV